MKSFLPFKQLYAALMLASVITLPEKSLRAQSGQDLSFRNSSLFSGTAGSLGAVYRFPSVTSTLDALVKINDRSSSSVKLESIDLTNTGFDKAFQPQISYSNGSVNSASNWWMEFEITFVNKNTTTLANISTFKATALDIDGDNSRLKEWVSFYGLNSYTLENSSLLQVSDILQTLLGVLQTVGKTFNGVTTQYSGIDTAQTNIMATSTYNSKNTFRFRTGASTTGAASVTARMYALWFKNFTYNAPVVSTLPVKLISFTAALNAAQDKADLKWSTASEINVSHFVVEKSYDGLNFNDAGLVFAYGNTNEKKDYSFSDNIANASKYVIYYRLRSVDIDTRSQLSETRIIRIGKQGESFKMIAYPNPVTNEMIVTLPSAWQGKPVSLTIYSEQGQLMKRFTAANASQTETIKVNDLKKGFYVLKANCGAEISQQKIIKN